MTKYKGEIVLVMVAVIWGTGFVTTTVVLQQLAPFQLLAVRFLLSTLMMSVVCYKKVLALNKTTVKYGAVLGLFLFLGFAFQTIGLELTTPAKNAFITSVNVVCVPFIGAIVYRRKIDIHGVMGAAIALSGIGLLSLKLDAPISIGDVLTLICAVLFAMHIFFTSEFMARGADAASVVIVQMAVACVLSFAAAIMFGQTDYSRANLTGFLMLAYLAAFGTSICFFLQTWAQKFTSETKAAIIMSMECVFGALFSILLRYESMTLRMAAGGLLILGGVLVTEIKPSFGISFLKKGE